GDGEARTPAQATERIGDIAPDTLDIRRYPHRVRCLAIVGDIAEGAPARLARLLRGEAGGLELPLLHRKVKLHLLSKLGVTPATRRDVQQSSQESHGPLIRSSELQHVLDRQHDALELLALGGELLATRGGERVVTCAAVVLRRPPLGLDPTVEEKPLKSRIERALADAEDV